MGGVARLGDVHGQRLPPRGHAPLQRVVVVARQLRPEHAAPMLTFLFKWFVLVTRPAALSAASTAAAQVPRHARARCPRRSGVGRLRGLRDAACPISTG